MPRSDVLRAVLRPAPLALLALALALATGFAFLGQWQLDRSQAVEASPALERPRPLGEVLAPAETFRSDGDGQVVTATGRFGADLLGDPAAGADGQVLVAGRDRDGRDGSWVVAPFRVDGAGGAEGVDGTAAGAAARPAVLPVVLGWVDPDVAARGAVALPAPPPGEVEVTGRLLVGEPPESLGSGPDGAVVRAVAPADLVNVWDGRLYTGFVIAEQPAAAPPLAQVSSAPPLIGTDWRSFSYALQWWLFAGFAVFFWWRVVRERFLPDALAQAQVRAAAAEDRLAALEARRASEREDRPRPDRRTDVHDHVEAR